MGFTEPLSSIQYQYYADRIRMRITPGYQILPINRIAPYEPFAREQKVREEKTNGSAKQKDEKKMLSEKHQPADDFPFTGKGFYLNDFI